MSATCHGCGTPLPPSKGPVRKWCSERCRKASYGDPCVDCGARTVYGAETARVPEPRCRACYRQRVELGLRADMVRAQVQRKRIEQLWSEGRETREIAADLGWSPGHVSMELHRMRGKGYDLPRRPPGGLRRKAAA
jgi:hypothetical protein